MKWFFKGDLKSRLDTYNLGLQHGLFSINDIKENEARLNLIDEMIKQVEDLKAIVKVEQLLNDRMLEILNEISDK